MTFFPETARTWVDVDLGALVENARTVGAACGSRLLPMVKANGYGLGAIPVARALEQLEPWGYGVATEEEGAALRQGGIARPILVLSPYQADAADRYRASDLRPTIGDPSALQAWITGGGGPFHLEIDTGMGRTGIRWDDAAALESVGVALTRAAQWEGIFTHFHSADTDPASAELQWRRFRGVLERLPRHPPLIHAANSAAALQGRKYAADMVRPGIFLYGGEAGGAAPRPVAALRARVVAVRRLQPGDSVSYGGTWCASRPTTIATLGVGYADGLLRGPDRAADDPPRLVEVRGRAVPLAGRVTMDLTMAAVEEDDVAVGDVATLYGGLVSLDAQARAAGSIAYELLTALGRRVVRRYQGA